MSDVILKLKKEINNFLVDEDGDIAIMFAMIVPVLLWLMIYFENVMQARYIYNQTQTVLDLATKGAAFTGKVIETGNGKLTCTIPYDTSDKNFSGDHVAKKLLIENLDTLPNYVKNSILEQLNNNQIIGFNDPDLRAGGYVQMKVRFKYRPDTPLFFNHYVFTVSSTSKCEVD